jgi:hypothetical protein
MITVLEVILALLIYACLYVGLPLLGIYVVILVARKAWKSVN